LNVVDLSFSWKVIIIRRFIQVAWSLKGFIRSVSPRKRVSFDLCMVMMIGPFILQNENGLAVCEEAHRCVYCDKVAVRVANKNGL